MIWPSRRRGEHAPPARHTLRASKLNAEPLEDRSVPATFIPNAFGGGTFAPFDNPALEVRSASGDVNGDGVADIITAEGPGAGSGSRVRIFDGRAARFAAQAVPIADFYAYSDGPGASTVPGFAGGLFVASADFNGDGFAEVVTSPGAGASGHIKVFDCNAGGSFAGSAPALRASFFAYPGFQGEIRVAALSPVLGATPLLATASGAGTTQSDVRLYANVFGIGQVDSGTLVVPRSQSFPYPGYLGGVSVAGGSNGQLFVSPNTAASQVSTFTLSPFASISLTPGVTFQTGFIAPTDVRLGSADVNGDGVLDVLTSSVVSGATSPISAFSPANDFTALNTLSGFQGFGFFGDAWLGAGAFTGAAVSPAGAIGLAGAGGIAGQGLVAMGGTQGLPSGNMPAPFNSGTGGTPSYTSNETPVFFNPGASGPTAAPPSNSSLAPGIF